MQHLKRISLEEAKPYISTKDDFLGSDPAFFTLEPEVDGWEKITYYTTRKKLDYSRMGDGNSWVYILSNSSMPGLFKIGYTKSKPEIRAKQISSATGVAQPYIVEWAFKCHDGDLLENEVHGYLDSYRVSTNREFFQISLEEAKQAVEFLGQRYI
jgi:hypothetical protein